MLVVIGDLVEDVVAWPHGPLEPATDNPARIQRSRGGSAANVAAAAAPLVPTRFIGRVGADAVGARLTADLAAAGVDVRTQAAGRTGTVIILVAADGERTMIPDRAGAAELDSIDPEWLTDASWLHLPLYGLLTVSAREVCLGAATLVRANGGTVSVDLSSTSAIRQLDAELPAVLGRLSPDVVIANADEAECARLHDTAPGSTTTFVIKHGPAPVEIVTADAVETVEVPPVDDVRDTTGAGDAFAAGYIAARMGGASERDAVTAGIGLAARTLRSMGSTLA